VQMLLGDAKGALATARQAEKGAMRGLALTSAGTAQMTADRAAAVATLSEAAKELAWAKEGGMRADLLAMSLRRLAEAGGAAAAAKMLDKEAAPRVRALGLLAIVEGMAEAAKREVKKKP
jgi:hypothetical protein